MLSDLYLLELYYDAPETACFYEDLAQRYNPGQLQNAIESGYLIGRRILFGPDCGRQLFWLSEAGRIKAQSTLA